MFLVYVMWFKIHYVEIISPIGVLWQFKKSLTTIWVMMATLMAIKHESRNGLHVVQEMSLSTYVIYLQILSCWTSCEPFVYELFTWQQT
jgi:hypothetical protein